MRIRQSDGLPNSSKSFLSQAQTQTSPLNSYVNSFSSRRRCFSIRKTLAITNFFANSQHILNYRVILNRGFWWAQKLPLWMRERRGDKMVENNKRAKFVLRWKIKLTLITSHFGKWRHFYLRNPLQWSFLSLKLISEKSKALSKKNAGLTKFTSHVIWLL